MQRLDVEGLARMQATKFIVKLAGLHAMTGMERRAGGREEEERDTAAVGAGAEGVYPG